MTPKKTARFHALREKTKGSSGLTGAEDVEYGYLVEERRAEILGMIPVPMCCEAARKYPAVSFEAGGCGDDDDSLTDPGRWWVAMNDGLARALAKKDRNYYRDAYPEPKFCPYCGTALPRMRRKEPERLPHHGRRLLLRHVPRAAGQLPVRSTRERLRAGAVTPKRSRVA